MATLPVYSSRDVKISWSGEPIDGLAPDTFITFSRNSDLTDEEVGADGQLSISRLPDRTGTMTITLQQQSMGNHILSGVMERQEASGVFIRGAITISDPSGSILAELGAAHLKTAPEVGLGSTATGQTRDWVFFCESMKFTTTPGGANFVEQEITRINSAIDSIATIGRAAGSIAGAVGAIGNSGLF